MRETWSHGRRAAPRAATAAGAMKALDQAYVPVQKPRDLATVQRALALARRIQAERTLTGRERRKARNIVEA